MEWLAVLRWVHVVGAMVLLGTGTGIAFFMLMAHRTRNPAIVAHTAQFVVLADWLFTAPAVVLQPMTGAALAIYVGRPLTELWILVSVALYIAVGCCWLPVVWIQHRMHTLARAAAQAGHPLPAAYFRLFRIWFALGVPAFVMVLAIVYLMVWRPSW